MPALPKPHRIAVLLADVKIEGPDAAFEREAAALMWMACIEICQRHPRLAVLDANATPLAPRDGHFAPHEAGRGGRPTDTFYAPTRRDELIWLEMLLAAKPGVMRLHVVDRDGKHASFDASGRNIGELLHQVFGAWLAARKLGGLSRKIESFQSEDVFGVLRVIAPTLAEQARAWTAPSQKATPEVAEDFGEDETVQQFEVIEESEAPDSTVEAPPVDIARKRAIARPLVNRLQAPLKVAVMRLLELALREDLGDQILAIDPEHPQALLASFERAPSQAKDFALLRRVIASAPGWGRPHELLHGHDVRDPLSPDRLETIAAAGIAALDAPGNLEVLELAATTLRDAGRTDEAMRMLERAVTLDSGNARTHLALLDLHKTTGRVGAWLVQAMRSANLHGCPLDPALPWYPDQLQTDLRVSTALLHAGRREEAIALRANRLEGREATWPAQTRVLASWRDERRFIARSYAREGYFRGDPGRTVEGFSHVEPGDSVDLAMFLDALVAVGRDDHVPLAWGQLGLGRRLSEPVARLAAARALMAAGEWRRGLEELWRLELTEPGRDDHVAIARAWVVMSGAPIDVIETALAERIAIGAPTIARHMARDAADFVPAAAKSGLVARALGKSTTIEFDMAWLGGFSPDTRSRRAIDAMFAELGPWRQKPPSGFDISDELSRGDRLVNRWLEVAFTEASLEERTSLAQACAYIAAQALGRYLAATTALPCTIAGALRVVAGEALAMVRELRDALSDRDARALLGTLDPLLRRVDRWVGVAWLATVERSAGIDERSAGAVAGFVRDYPVVAARILGPEEIAVASWTVARLHRERPEGWAAKVIAQAGRLASHTGKSGVAEWADAVVAQLSAGEIEVDDAIDALHTACYLAEGASAIPCVHAARVLFDAGRHAAAFAVLTSGLGAAPPAWRDEQLAMLAGRWRSSRLDVPLELDKVALGLFEALQKGDPVRAEKLGRWMVAYDPSNSEAHRNLGIALASQGKTVDALHHLVRGTRDQATHILPAVLYQYGKLDEAMLVLDYASRWYTRADQWLTYGGIAYAAHDPARSLDAYRHAHELDPDAFDPSTLQVFRALEAGPTPPPRQLGKPREKVFELIEGSQHAEAAAMLGATSWRVRRGALQATRFRARADNAVAVTPLARAAAAAVLADTIGTMDREALLARALALAIRGQAYFARDPLPVLGTRVTRKTPAVVVVDREVIAGAKIARITDYVGLLRALARLAPGDALATLGLDEASYDEVARAWAAALDADPDLARDVTNSMNDYQK